jgi:hypothetical protein
MTRERYEDLLQDNSVEKLGVWHGRYFFNLENSLVVSFSFLHQGYPKTFSSDPERRIILSTFPKSSLNINLSLKTISSEAILMVNSDSYEFAMTFSLKIHSDTKTISFKVLDLPEMGSGLITDEEKNGIEANF